MPEWTSADFDAILRDRALLSARARKICTWLACKSSDKIWQHDDCDPKAHTHRENHCFLAGLSRELRARELFNPPREIDKTAIALRVKCETWRQLLVVQHCGARKKRSLNTCGRERSDESRFSIFHARPSISLLRAAEWIAIIRQITRY